LSEGARSDAAGAAPGIEQTTSWPGALRKAGRALADERWALCGLFLASLGYALWALRVGWDHSILDVHGFRQSQTAISTWSLLQGGPWVAYETPVLGAPWSLPFEFPLYQWIVALLVHLTGMGLESAGRLTSAVFYLSSALPIWSILGFLRVERIHRLVFLSIYFVSPIYLFWSRTFMIESTALFFSLTYLAFVTRWLERKHPRDAVLAMLLGIVAALVKVTTFVGFCYAAAAFVLLDWLRVHRGHISWRIFLDQWVPLLGFALIPMAVAKGWVGYTDELKSLNVLAGRYLNSENLAGWNFGSIQQRVDPASWRTLGSRIPLMIGHWAVLTAALGAALASPRSWLPVSVSLTLFVGVFLTFTNLHLVHDYYQYANAIFLIAAVGFSVRSLLVGSLTHRWAGVLALGLVLSTCIGSYRGTYLESQKSDRRDLEPLAQEIQKSTSPNDVILVWGGDWNSQIPYLARRRALMIWPEQLLDDEIIAEAFRRLDSYKIGAMVVCGSTRRNPEYIRKRSSLHRMQIEPSFGYATCQLHLPANGARSDS
jgi:hypothetical protein